MTDTHLDSLCDPIQCFLDQPAKEDQTIENSPITLLQILLLQIHRQLLQEVILLLEVKLLANIDALLDIVIDLLLELGHIQQKCIDFGCKHIKHLSFEFCTELARL